MLDEALDCPKLHGEAARGELVAIGCDDGVLLVAAHGDHVDTTKLAEPAGTAEGVRVGTLRSHEDVGFFLGNFGPESLVRISPRAGTLTPVPIPGTVRSFWLHDARGGTAVVLTTAGGCTWSTRAAARSDAPPGSCPSSAPPARGRHSRSARGRRTSPTRATGR